MIINRLFQLPVLVFIGFIAIFSSCKPSKAITEVDSNKPAQQTEALVDTDYYLTVQKMPEFQGGDINTFITYLQKQIKYPQAALNKKKQGLTAIQIGIDCYGKVNVLSILKSSGSKLLDNEAKRAILTSPKWNPAILDKKAVGKLYVLQFKFNATTRKIEIK
jgi:TonB family protein